MMSALACAYGLSPSLSAGVCGFAVREPGCDVGRRMKQVQAPSMAFAVRDGR